MERWAPRQLTSTPPKPLGRVHLEALCLLNLDRIQDKLENSKGDFWREIYSGFLGETQETQDSSRVPKQQEQVTKLWHHEVSLYRGSSRSPTHPITGGSCASVTLRKKQGARTESEVPWEPRPLLASSQGLESELFIFEVPVPKLPGRLLYCSLSCPESEAPVGSHLLPPGNFMKGYFVGNIWRPQKHSSWESLWAVREHCLFVGRTRGVTVTGQLIPRKDSSQKMGRRCCLKRQTWGHISTLPGQASASPFKSGVDIALLFLVAIKTRPRISFFLTACSKLPPSLLSHQLHALAAFPPESPVTPYILSCGNHSSQWSSGVKTLTICVYPGLRLKSSKDIIHGCF